MIALPGMMYVKKAVSWVLRCITNRPLHCRHTSQPTAGNNILYRILTGKSREDWCRRRSKDTRGRSPSLSPLQRRCSAVYARVGWTSDVKTRHPSSSISGMLMDASTTSWCSWNSASPSRSCKRRMMNFIPGTRTTPTTVTSQKSLMKGQPSQPQTVLNSWNFESLALHQWTLCRTEQP